MPTTMQRLRTTRHLARLLLACFAMALGVATAAPLVRAHSPERVCTASGEVRWVVAGPGGTVGTATGEGGAHLLDCALCLPPMLAGPPPRLLAGPQGAPAHDAAAASRPGHIPALSRAPFPPRAPPA